MISYYTYLRNLLLSLKGEISSLTSKEEADALSQAISHMISRINRILTLLYDDLKHES